MTLIYILIHRNMYREASVLPFLNYFIGNLTLNCVTMHCVKFMISALIISDIFQIYCNNWGHMYMPHPHNGVKFLMKPTFLQDIQETFDFTLNPILLLK